MEQALPSLIFFIGPPGSGKGTQSMLLAEHEKMVRVEMSKLLEARFLHSKPGETITVNGTPYVLQEQREKWKTGLLVDPEFVAFVFMEKLEALVREGSRVVVDGYPRRIEQMEGVLPRIDALVGRKNIVALILDVSEEDSLYRNANRRVCALMRHPILSVPETKQLTLCPLDGSELISRIYDNPEVIRTRLRVFQEETLPLLKFFEEREIGIHRINGSRSVADVFEDILKAAR